MTICPRCNQTSNNDKVCTNCWADLVKKDRSSKKTDDVLESKLKNVVVLGAGAILVVFLMSWIMDMMKPAPQEGMPVVQQQNQAPAPIERSPIQQPTPTIDATPTAADVTPTAEVTPSADAAPTPLT